MKSKCFKCYDIFLDLLKCRHFSVLTALKTEAGEFYLNLFSTMKRIRKRIFYHIRLNCVILYESRREKNGFLHM